MSAFCLGLFFGTVGGLLFAWIMREQTECTHHAALKSQQKRGDYWFSEYREAIKREALRSRER